MWPSTKGMRGKVLVPFSFFRKTFRITRDKAASRNRCTNSIQVRDAERLSGTSTVKVEDHGQDQ
jgi:hypothetical protein